MKPSALTISPSFDAGFLRLLFVLPLEPSLTLALDDVLGRRILHFNLSSANTCMPSEVAWAGWNAESAAIFAAVDDAASAEEDAFAFLGGMMNMRKFYSFSSKHLFMNETQSIFALYF
ncbi:MAG: hypothetical protein IPH52_27545 [Leptospiraceae bacterium]|nr:hypothetical protein [Leptospiraceae bacterium]